MREGLGRATRVTAATRRTACLTTSSVIAASSITKSGPVINGNSVKMVILKTDPGYGPAPGHTGTGTVTAVICPP